MLFDHQRSRPHRQVSGGWQGAGSSAVHSAESEGGSVAYKGMVDCFVRTVKEEGWQALFKVQLISPTLCMRHACHSISTCESNDYR